MKFLLRVYLFTIWPICRSPIDNNSQLKNPKYIFKKKTWAYLNIEMFTMVFSWEYEFSQLCRIFFFQWKLCNTLEYFFLIHSPFPNFSYSYTCKNIAFLNIKTQDGVSLRNFPGLESLVQFPFTGMSHIIKQSFPFLLFIYYLIWCITCITFSTCFTRYSKEECVCMWIFWTLLW